MAEVKKIVVTIMESGEWEVKPYNKDEAYQKGFRDGKGSGITRDEVLKVLKDYQAMSRDDKDQTDYEAFSWAIREIERELPF